MELDELFRGLDAPRPIPTSQRTRLEDSLLEDHLTSDLRDDADTHADLQGADVPRPLPPGLHRRLEAALLGRLSGGSGTLADGRPRRRRAVLLALTAVAASVALLASVLVVARTPEETSGRSPRTAAAGPLDEVSRPPDEPRAVVERGPRPEGAPVRPAPAPAPPKAATSSDTAPPFTSGEHAHEMGSVRAEGPPLVVGTVRGDAAQEAGFRAYLELLNASGGIRGRPLEAVEVSAETPGEATIATVNLSKRSVATRAGPPDWVAGRGASAPLLETLTAPEDVLRGSVFGLSSAPERQAHLLVDAVFPEPAPGAIAAVYRGIDGVFAERVPEALREALEAREVTVVEATYEPGRPTPFVPADAAFLSLPQEDALHFLDYAQRAGYHPPRAMGCLFPMLDRAIVSELADGYLVLSPYSLGSDAERSALEVASGRPVSTGTIHGWVAAKALAAAVWRSGADSPPEVLEALSDLAGLQLGFAPELAFRSGTNARTPDGILHEVRDGRFVPQGGFRTDPS